MSGRWLALVVVSSVCVIAIALLWSCDRGSDRGARGSASSVATKSILDVDGNGKADALTDGILIMRDLQGVTGSALTEGALGPGATRTSASAIQAYIDKIKPRLDIDGNGRVDAQSDGVLIIRYLLRFRGAVLVNHAVGLRATRTTSSQIEQYLAHL